MKRDIWNNSLGLCLRGVCARLCVYMRAYVCVLIFCCVLLSSRQYEFTFSPEWKSGKPWVCVRVSACAMHLLLRQWEVYVCGERKGWRLYVCVSFFPSLSECLFLDRFEGQGLATGGEKAVFPFKREKKKSSRSLFTMKRRLNTHHPLKALTLALPYTPSQHRPMCCNRSWIK